MKKIITIFSLVLSITTLITSCGGGSKKEKEKVVLPDPPTDLKYEGVTLIDGPLSKYVEVVPGAYLFELKKNESEFMLGYSGTMKVKFKFIKSINVKEGRGYNDYGPSLLGKALDEQGAPLEFDLSVNTDKDLATYLLRGSGEEWITLNISGQGSCNDLPEAQQQLEKYKKGKKIRFNSEIVEEEFETASSSSSSDKVSSDNSGGDCDAFLADYEDFMNKYIEVLKKYKDDPTDTGILADYTSLMSEASTWASKTADCASDAKFAAKFAAIQSKIAKALSGM